MNRFLIFCLLMLLPSWVYAQDVEGVEVGTKMTYAQVVAKFGQPDEVKIWDEDFPEGSKVRDYHYGESHLIFSDTDGLIGFGIRDNGFKLLVNYLEDGLLVGDSLSKIQDVDIHGPLEKHDTVSDGSEIYYLFSHTDCPLWIWAKDGIITYIWLSIPV